MGREINFRCDAPNCKAIRGELNHWFIFQTANGWLSFSTLDGHEALLENSSKDCGCVCSRGCAQIVFETFLASSLTKLNTRSEITSDELTKGT